MRLKSVLMLVLLTLTIIPITIVSMLFYKSGFKLSKESYARNLIESLNVQADYISQAMDNRMIGDQRFANQNIILQSLSGESSALKDDLFAALTAYLSAAEDKITVCLLLNQQGDSVYAIGEKAMVDAVGTQLIKPSESTKQAIMEFDWGDGSYSLGIVTPVWDQNTYMGCLVSVYDKSYLFKIISSYYEIVDTSTYICRQNGDIVSSRSISQEDSATMEQVLHELAFNTDGAIDIRTRDVALSGYYKNIHNTPWYLIGFVDDELIYSFTNQFLTAYILLIIGVLLVDILLAFYCSHRVVRPINSLIHVMEGYQNNLNGEELGCGEELDCGEEHGYYETNFLRAKFSELMKKILLVQHNFQGIYQLYESGDMGDTNIDIDTKNQTISSNKDVFQELMNKVDVPEGACIVETFTHCFCEKDQRLLMELFVEMRDEHLSAIRAVEVFTPHLGEKWFHTLIVPMYENDRLSRLFIQLRDISSFKKQELESQEQVKRDPLTGLYNRVGFTSCVGSVLQVEDNASLHALLFIDMDYFKLVNDNFGHSAGDDLLRAVSGTLLEVAGSENIVSRFGGDEFAVFLSNTSAEAISEMEHALKQKLIYSFHTEKLDFVVSASIGVSIWHHDSPNTLESLLQQADAAMYKAKRDFKENIN